MINIWVQLGYIPSPAEVSEREGINLVSRKGKAFSAFNTREIILHLSCPSKQHLDQAGSYCPLELVV